MTNLSTLISNFYIIKNNIMSIEKYNKLLLLYKNIKSHSDVYVNQVEWEKLYRLNQKSLPQSPPIKENILNSIRHMLNVKYLDLIENYYKFLDTSKSLQNISIDSINTLTFMIFIFSKKNTKFTIDKNVWNSIRNKCLIGKQKTKMPRDPTKVSEIINQINNILLLNQ